MHSRLLLPVVLAGLALVPRAADAGVVGNGTPGSCTEAAFNTALATGTVTFNCGGGAVVIPFTSTKTLTTSTTIDGTGQNITLDGGGARRLFQTTYQFASFTLTFRALTIRNGHAPDFGGAIRLAYQDFITTLVIENVTFQNNICDAAGNDVGGGALYAQGGIVTIRNSTFTGNRGGNGGAIGNLQARFTIEDSVFTGNSTNAHVGDGGNGGAIYIDGSGGGQLVVRRTRFQGNTAAWIGGAFHTYLYAGGTGMSIEDSTFQANTTYANGGAIYHQNGALTITRSTFADNTTRGQGGALWLLQANPASISNSTFTGNQAIGIPPNNGSSGLGGAILINGQNAVTISHCTIANNHADWVGGGITGGMSGGSTTSLRGTIVANNTAANGGNPWNIAHNCSTQLLDGGGNMQFPNHAHPTDPNDPNCTAAIPIADPLLGPLADNGGPTQTRALDISSPARNIVTGCPPPATDQRGELRPQGSACDAGAYERTPSLFVEAAFHMEGTGTPTNVTFAVRLSEASAQTVTVAYATVDGTALAGADYAAVSGIVTFPPGTTTRTVDVPLVPDAMDENDELFTLAISSPVHAVLLNAGNTATIIDDDSPPVISAGDCVGVEGTGAGGACVFAATLDNPSGKPIDFGWVTVDGTAQAPADYEASSGTLTIPPGATSITQLVRLAGDAQDETDETFTWNLVSVHNALPLDPEGVGTIDDDDGPVVTVSSPSVVEGDAGTTPASFTLTLSGPSVQPVIVPYTTLNGTATGFADFQPVSGTLTFGVGTTGQGVSVPVIGDTLDEPNETFSLQIGPVTDGRPAETSTLAYIQDDDGGPIALGELGHGTVRRETLEAPDLFVVHEPALTSWEVVLDEGSGDAGPGTGPRLERLDSAMTIVLQSSTAVGVGPARVLRWTNPLPFVEDSYVRVSSAGCTTDCGPDDGYRLRAYDTTGRVARFNAAGGQSSVLVLQNPRATTVNGTAYFWSSAGVMLGSQAFTLGPRGTLVQNVATVAGVASQSGSITVTHDAGYGGLEGKAVALEPASGFSFDTPLVYRPR